MTHPRRRLTRSLYVPCPTLLNNNKLIIDLQGTRFYQSIAVLWGYILREEEGMAPHDYLDDLESFFYVLCQAIISKVSKGKSLSRRADNMLAAWQSADFDYSRTSKVEFVRMPFRNSYVDTDYWGEACRSLIKKYHAFVQLVNDKKDNIRCLEEVDLQGQVEMLRGIGDIDTHYRDIDKMFQEALDALITEEPKIEARLGNSLPAAPGDAQLVQPGLKRRSDEMEDFSGMKRPSKRRH